MCAVETVENSKSQRAYVDNMRAKTKKTSPKKHRQPHISQQDAVKHSMLAQSNLGMIERCLKTEFQNSLPRCNPLI